MKIVKVTYTVKAEFSEANMSNVSAVMSALHAACSPGNFTLSTTELVHPCAIMRACFGVLDQVFLVPAVVVLPAYSGCMT